MGENEVVGHILNNLQNMFKYMQTKIKLSFSGNYLIIFLQSKFTPKYNAVFTSLNSKLSSTMKYLLLQDKTSSLQTRSLKIIRSAILWDKFTPNSRQYF